MDFNTSRDTRAEHLQDHLEHLEELLSQKQRNHLVNTFHELIQEEKEQCLLKLKQIKENQTSERCTPSASASPFQVTN